MSRVIHIAGVEVQVGQIIRQRCSWCGVMLSEVDLQNDAWAPNEDGSVPDPVSGWGYEKLVFMEGVNPVHMGVIEHVNGDQMPAGFCGDEGKPRLRAVETPRCADCGSTEVDDSTVGPTVYMKHHSYCPQLLPAEAT